MKLITILKLQIVKLQAVINNIETAQMLLKSEYKDLGEYDQLHGVVHDLECKYIQFQKELDKELNKELYN